VEPSEIKVRSFYETHARSYDSKDFQSQVARQARSGPVGPEQITMITDGISKGLDISFNDVLLDLCCGNGVITDLIFERCLGGVGVDFTPYLIEVAKANFERAPDRVYQLADVLEYLETTEEAERFTKVVCYGAFQCLLESKATDMLLTLRRRFPNVKRVFLGNLPNLDRAPQFFRQEVGVEAPPTPELKSLERPGGVWRTEEEMRELVTGCGWCVEFSRMPPEFFVAYCRFDATLTLP
jgi:SAM-dependent methyltransferase